MFSLPNLSLHYDAKKCQRLSALLWVTWLMRGKAREARTMALFGATAVSSPPLEDVNYGDTVFYLCGEGGGVPRRAF